ncbi:glutamate-1-semialdehyde 2,1-aminomutase [Streptomyces tanashiensis]
MLTAVPPFPMSCPKSFSQVRITVPYSSKPITKTFDRTFLVTPGGVNSPVRAFRAVGGTPG